MPWTAEVTAARVLVCGGPDCAKDRRDDRKALVAACAEAGVAMRSTKCLGLCHGPVAVVVRPAGKPIVVERIRRRRHRRALVAVANGRRLDRDVLRVPRKAKRRRRALRRAGL